jgi:hypothetical protein
MTVEQLMIKWAECALIIQNIQVLDRDRERIGWREMRDLRVIELSQLMDETTAYVNEVVGSHEKTR